MGRAPGTPKNQRRYVRRKFAGLGCADEVIRDRGLDPPGDGPRCPTHRQLLTPVAWRQLGCPCAGCDHRERAA